jgi:hypothetical protein
MTSMVLAATGMKVHSLVIAMHSTTTRRFVQKRVSSGIRRERISSFNFGTELHDRLLI